jgi:hypothetical protein
MFSHMIFYSPVHGFQIRHHQNFGAAHASDNWHPFFVSSKFAFAILARREVDFLDVFSCHFSNSGLAHF